MQAQPLDLTRPHDFRNQVASIAFSRWADEASATDLEDLERAASTMAAIIHGEQSRRARRGDHTLRGLAA